MSTQGLSFKGSCACGNIKFESDSRPTRIVYCYCVSCAKVAGSGFIPFVELPKKALKWTGEPEIWRKSTLAQRGFCSTCGSTIFMSYDAEPTWLGLAQSLIDWSEKPMDPPELHIFVAEKAEWVSIPDDRAKRLERHETAFQEEAGKLENHAK